MKNIKVLIGTIMLLGILSMSLIGRRLLPYNPLSIGLFPRDQPPSLTYIAGTDNFGRDVFGQLLLGTENSLQIAFIVATIATIVGATLGFTAGYVGGKTDSILRSLSDIFIVLPMLPMVILISSFVRIVEIWLMALIISCFAWPNPARLVRSQALTLREKEFVYVAKLSGKGTMRIVFTDLVPHMVPFLTANFMNLALWAILTEAGLSIIGLGPQHTMTLGMMLFWAMNRAAFFRGLWWWWTSPVFVIMLTLMSFYLITTGLDEIANPRLKAERG